jgi:hypothetical protein
VKKTIEDALQLITENAAIIQSAMYDPELDQANQTGLGRLASEIRMQSEQIRYTLDSNILLVELIGISAVQ